MHPPGICWTSMSMPWIFQQPVQSCKHKTSPRLGVVSHHQEEFFSRHKTLFYSQHHQFIHPCLFCVAYNPIFGNVESSFFAMRPFSAALKMRSRHNILPLIVQVAANVAFLVSDVHQILWIVHEPLMNHVPFQWNVKEIGVLSLFKTWFGFMFLTFCYISSMNSREAASVLTGLLCVVCLETWCIKPIWWRKRQTSC